MRKKEAIYAALGLSAIVAFGNIAQPAVAEVRDDFNSGPKFESDIFGFQEDSHDLVRLRHEKPGTIYLRGIGANTRENISGDIEEACPSRNYQVNYSIRYNQVGEVGPMYTANAVCKPR